MIRNLIALPLCVFVLALVIGCGGSGNSSAAAAKAAEVLKELEAKKGQMGKPIPKS